MVEFLGAILLFGVVLVFATLLLVMVRQAAVILLVIISPIAFALAILPNTKSLFTKWRKTFVGFLILFPEIGVIMGGSYLAQQIFVSIANSTSGLTATFWQLAALAITVLPLIAIPFVMKSSLNGLGKIGAAVGGFAAGRVSARSKATGAAFGRTAPAQFAKNVKTSYKNNQNRRAVRRGANFANHLTQGRQKVGGLYNKTLGQKKVFGAIGRGVGKATNGLADYTGVNSALNTLSKGGVVLDKKADAEAMESANAWASEQMQGMGRDEVFSALNTGKMADGHELSAHETRALAEQGMGKLTVHQKEAVLAKNATSQNYGLRQSLINSAKASGYQVGAGAVGDYTNMSKSGREAYNSQAIAASALKSTKVLGEGDGDVREYLESANTVGGQLGADGKTWNAGQSFTGEGNKNYADMIRNNSSDALEKASKEGGSSEAMQAKRGITAAQTPTVSPSTSNNSETNTPATQSSLIIPNTSPRNVRETIKFDDEQKIDHAPEPAKPSNPSFYGANDEHSYTQGTQEVPKDGVLNLGPDDIHFTGGKPPEK